MSKKPKKIGDYELVEPLGKGGFGTVWKARSMQDSMVALKVLNPKALEDQKVVNKFFHEAIIMAKLDHPHIAKLLDFFSGRMEKRGGHQGGQSRQDDIIDK